MFFPFFQTGGKSEYLLSVSLHHVSQFMGIPCSFCSGLWCNLGFHLSGVLTMGSFEWISVCPE